MTVVIDWDQVPGGRATVRDLALFLGITESGVRQIVRRYAVARVGKGVHGAALYRAGDVLRHAGGRDRLTLAQ